MDVPDAPEHVAGGTDFDLLGYEAPQQIAAAPEITHDPFAAFTDNERPHEPESSAPAADPFDTFTADLLSSNEAANKEENITSFVMEESDPQIGVENLASPNEVANTDESVIVIKRIESRRDATELISDVPSAEPAIIDKVQILNDTFGDDANEVLTNQPAPAGISANKVAAVAEEFPQSDVTLADRNPAVEAATENNTMQPEDCEPDQVPEETATREVYEEGNSGSNIDAPGATSFNFIANQNAPDNGFQVNYEIDETQKEIGDGNGDDDPNATITDSSSFDFIANQKPAVQQENIIYGPSDAKNDVLTHQPTTYDKVKTAVIDLSDTAVELHTNEHTKAGAVEVSKIENITGHLVSDPRVVLIEAELKGNDSEIKNTASDIAPSFDFTTSQQPTVVDETENIGLTDSALGSTASGAVEETHTADDSMGAANIVVEEQHRTIAFEDGNDINGAIGSNNTLSTTENETVTGETIVDKLPNDMSIQNATTEEEAEWLSLGLGLTDALKQVIALTEERDAALAMCQEREDQSGAHVKSEDLLAEVQSRLQAEMDRRAESDSQVREMREEIQRYDNQLVKYSTLEDDFEQVQANLVMILSEKSKLEAEIVKLREFKDESEQKEVLLSNRLNEARKKEANKGQAAGRLEAENDSLKKDLKKTIAELNAMKAAKSRVEANMEKLKTKAVERVKQAETALAEERELNEERKRKMKTFVESKADELREAKESASDMQIELQETRASLRASRDREEKIQRDLEDSRIKYRELQREIERLKRSQQEMHKMGKDFELELEKSASETEEHKKKRMSAKHELMTMVRALEVEKSVSGKLRESIKLTFTPKALSQQQLLSECLEDFESELDRLARKLGRTLSHPPKDGHEVDEPASNEDYEDLNGLSKKGKRTKADADTERLISNLEHETQHVSKGIMTLAGSIERMRSLMDEDNAFNCMAYFSNVLAGTVRHQEARHQRLGNNDDSNNEETVSMSSDQMI